MYKYICEKKKINKEKILSIILTGGVKYDSTEEHKDIDYLVIINDETKFERFYDEENKIDYLCFGLEFIQELIKNKETEHINKPFILLDLCNQDEHLVYGNKVIEYDLFSNINYIKYCYIKWLTKNCNAILKNLMFSKNIYYAFVLMFYYKNSKYYLTNEQQNIVNNIHKKKPVEQKYLDDFVNFYCLDNNFHKELNSLNKLYLKKQQKNKNALKTHIS